MTTNSAHGSMALQHISASSWDAYVLVSGIPAGGTARSRRSSSSRPGSALLPLTISVGQEQLVAMGASVAGV